MYLFLEILAGFAFVFLVLVGVFIFFFSTVGLLAAWFLSPPIGLGIAAVVAWLALRHANYHCY